MENNKKTSSSDKTKKSKRVIKKEEKAKKKALNATKNIRWLWFFVLLFVTIILLFMWDNHKKAKYMKTLQQSVDSLKYSEYFYKTKFKEKDSVLNVVMSDYNKILSKNLDFNKEIEKSKQDLIRLQKVVFLQDSILRSLKQTFDMEMTKYGKNVSVQMKDGKLYITMRNKLLFPSGSAVVQNSGYKVIRTVARILKSNPDISIVVEGHTDNVPISKKNKKFKDNWELSTARAVSVVRLLTEKYNIRPERLTAAGRSMYYPIAPNVTEEGRAKNRRIEFILTPDLEQLYKLADTQLQTR